MRYDNRNIPTEIKVIDIIINGDKCRNGLYSASNGIINISDSGNGGTSYENISRFLLQFLRAFYYPIVTGKVFHCA